MSKISVIVPIYNVEKFLRKSIESVCNQTYRNLEIILVNDGSIDNSLTICREYERKDKRICVIDKENGGVSSARNAGLQIASGDYIGFIDPDDWIDLEMYEKMYEKIISSDSDICMCNFIIKSLNGETPITLNTKKDILNKDEVIVEILSEMIWPLHINSKASTIMGSVWRALFKRELINNNSITFPEGITYMQDLVFMVHALLCLNFLCIDKGYHYHYVYNENSAIRGYKKNYYSISKNVVNRLENMTKMKNQYHNFKIRLELRYLGFVMNSIHNETHQNNPKNQFERMKSIRLLCQDEKLKSIIKKVDLSEYTLRKKVLLHSIYHENALYLYLYYSIYNLFIFRLAVPLSQLIQKIRQY